MDFLNNLPGKMAEWFWVNIIGPAISGTFAFIPLWVWIIIAGILVGYLFKKFGWQGVVGGVGAALLFLAYRQGWKNASDLHKRARGGDSTVEVTDEPTFGLPIPDLPAPKEKVKRPRPKQRYNPDTQTWEDVPPRKKR